MQITSPANQLVKQVAALHRKRVRAWPVPETDGAFSEAVLLRVAHHRDRVAPALTEQQLVDLWQLLHTRFPTDQDPVVHGAHIVTPRESVAS